MRRSRIARGWGKEPGGLLTARYVVMLAVTLLIAAATELFIAPPGLWNAAVYAAGFSLVWLMGYLSGSDLPPPVLHSRYCGQCENLIDTGMQRLISPVPGDQAERP